MVDLVARCAYAQVLYRLTVITTVFLPINYIAAIYGMNFKNPDGSAQDPLLGHAWGYRCESFNIVSDPCEHF